MPMTQFTRDRMQLQILHFVAMQDIYMKWLFGMCATAMLKEADGQKLAEAVAGEMANLRIAYQETLQQLQQDEILRQMEEEMNDIDPGKVN
jgi:hypothetical protein